MKIETLYNLLQPLSHIGESESTTSFLNTINVVNNGQLAEVFALTGNAIRGTLRDCAARYMLDRLNIKVPKKEFNILFSGGNISGSLTTDIDQAKKYRKLLPLVSVFGAGVGNQILNGKITQGFAFPVCQETTSIVQNTLDGIKHSLFDLSWKQQTGSVNFTRFDDLKNTNLQKYYSREVEKGTKNKKEEADSASTQMRYEVEYLIPGSQLYHNLILNTDNTIEIGCFYSALKEFSKSPCLGGMAGKGFGMMDAFFYIDGAKAITIDNCGFNFIDKSHEAYLESYNEFLDSYKEDVIEFLNAKHIQEDDTNI